MLKQAFVEAGWVRSGRGAILKPDEHWQRVWTSRPPTDVGWFETEPET